MSLSGLVVCSTFVLLKNLLGASQKFTKVAICNELKLHIFDRLGSRIRADTPHA